VQPDTVTTTHIRAGSVPPPDEAASPQEWLVARMAAEAEAAEASGANAPPLPEVPPPDVETARLLIHVRRACTIEQARMSTAPYGPHDGLIADADLLAELRKRFGPDHRWSVTQFNDYITCPFRFAARYVLGLQAPPEPEEEGLESVGRGRIYHEILEQAGIAWRRGNHAFTSDHKTAILEALGAAADEVLAGVSERPDFVQGAFWLWEQADVRRFLERSLRRILERAEDWSAFRVAAVEQYFGSRRPGSPPPLTLQTSEGPVLVRGRIDRIDQRDDGALAVIDYKSGSTRRPLPDTTSGRDVQLPIYMLAAEQLFVTGGQQVERAAFLHLGSGQHSQPLTTAERQMAMNALHARVAETIQGVHSGDFAVRPRDKCATGCAFAGICRLHVPKRDKNSQDL
jgi:RecB family exonuclease